MSSHDGQRDYIVVYDGYCSVCKRVIDLVRKWDRNCFLETVPSHMAGITARFPWIPVSAYAESVQVIRASDGKTWQGAAALEQILKVLPWGNFTSWLFTVPFIRPLAEKVYRRFARNRQQFGCTVPAPHRD